MAYYKRIRELREDNDKTQREIAEYLGTPYQYYSVYEKGGSEISFERAIALAKYYNVSLDYLAELTDVKTNSSVNTQSDNLRTLVDIINKMQPKEKKQLIDILKVLIKTLNEK
ncbi:MAG: helix-turn-helix domain-containing protein [Oscillospiraceae bacterium]